jgi:CheY-like chemotaxis protein
MDIMMPVMDGYETIEEIRKQDPLKNMPIIAVTAKAMDGDGQVCLEKGANAYLPKPVDKSKLLPMMAELIGANA